MTIPLSTLIERLQALNEEAKTREMSGDEYAEEQATIIYEEILKATINTLGLPTSDNATVTANTTLS